jgi:hypothetical protein
MSLIPFTPVYTPSVSFRELYYKNYSPNEKTPRDMMRENLKYSLKIAEKLVSQEKYKDAIYFYEEAIKLGGNERMIRFSIYDCERKIEIINNFNKKIIL